MITYSTTVITHTLKKTQMAILVLSCPTVRMRLSRYSGMRYSANRSCLQNARDVLKQICVLTRILEVPLGGKKVRTLNGNPY